MQAGHRTPARIMLRRTPTWRMAYDQLQQRDQAIAAAEKAIELARSQDQKQEAEQIEAWLKTYRGENQKSESAAPQSFSKHFLTRNRRCVWPTTNSCRCWRYVLMAGVGWLLYARALSAPFVFDDSITVADNGSITRLWPLVGRCGASRAAKSRRMTLPLPAVRW